TSCPPRNWTRRGPGRSRPGCSTRTQTPCWRSTAGMKRCNGFCMPPPQMSRVSPMPKTGSVSSADMGTLAQEYDCLLLDLDGTVFRGHELTEGAAESLEKADGRKLFVTNNASRSADQVAGHLHDIGLLATADDVVTSAQSAAHVLADQLEPGS